MKKVEKIIFWAFILCGLILVYFFDIEAGGVLFGVGIFLLVVRSKFYKQFRSKIPKKVTKFGIIWSVLLCVCVLSIILLMEYGMLDAQTAILLFILIPILISIPLCILYIFLYKHSRDKSSL